MSKRHHVWAVAALAALSGFATEPLAASSQLLNISTRLRVESGDNLDRILIGGFIVEGAPGTMKKVILRALGPSLIQQGVSGVLPNPVLAAYNRDGRNVASNDNWKESQRAEIEASTIPPPHDLEAAVIVTLPSGAYTARVYDVADAKGVALVEVYDLEPSSPARLANISTRGYVRTGEEVMIGGFILGPEAAEASRVVVRALGPSLASAGLQNTLQNPTVELRDRNGDVIASNDNWKESAESQTISDAGLAPPDDREAALYAVLSPSNYTAIVRGVSNGTGIGLVEVYQLQ